jgi:hypothetical protein
MSVDIHSLPGPDRVSRVRTERYIGDDNGVSLAVMSPAHADTVRRTYSFLKSTLSALESAIQDAAPLQGAERLKELDFLEHVRGFAGRLSTEEYDDEQRMVLRRVFHDMRGGALNVAYSLVQLAFMKGSEVELSDIYGIFFRVRDHLKIMRNCVEDLDPERRHRDLMRRTHSAALMREKWEGYTDGSVRIDYVSNFDGGLSSSCLEFSTVERAMYNLVNNAISHTADGYVQLFVTALEPDEPENVKIATANAISLDEQAEIERAFGDNLGDLFEGGFTIGGSGIGLSVCARMVSRAYGVESIRRTIEDGYVGAALRDDAFISWMHWPVWHE